jgi:hypothetical protein
VGWLSAHRHRKLDRNVGKIACQILCEIGAA